MHREPPPSAFCWADSLPKRYRKHLCLINASASSGGPDSINLAEHPAQWSWSQSSRGRTYCVNRRAAPRVHIAFSIRQSAIVFKLPWNYPDRVRHPVDRQCPTESSRFAEDQVISISSSLSVMRRANPSGRRDCREQQLFSTSPAANAARGSRPKLTSSAVIALSMAGRNYPRNWAGKISVLAAPHVGFKKCCMRTNRNDGKPRKHYNR